MDLRNHVLLWTTLTLTIVRVIGYISYYYKGVLKDKGGEFEQLKDHLMKYPYGPPK